MSRIDDVKTFVRNAPDEYAAMVTEPSIDSMIDATITGLQKETGMERSPLRRISTCAMLSSISVLLAVCASSAPS
jgi:hypothetical protein